MLNILLVAAVTVHLIHQQKSLFWPGSSNMSCKGREVILGDDLPKGDAFAVASSVQFTQKNKERREKTNTKKLCPKSTVRQNCV